MECPCCSMPWSSELYIPRILSCGHTICEPCAKNLFKICKIHCQICKSYHSFNIERQFDDSDESFSSKCINSMSKNFTLLSLITSRSSAINQRSNEIEDIDVHMCEDHNLPLHSFTEKPYSILCDKCIEEISEYDLIIKPIPEISNYFTEKLKEIPANLTSNRKECEDMIQNYLTLENHFNAFNLFLEEAKNDIRQQLEDAITEQALANRKEKKKNKAKKLLIKELKGQYEFLEGLEENDLVKHIESLESLLDKSNPPQEKSEKTCLSINTNKALFASIQDILNLSYEINIKKNTNF